MHTKNEIPKKLANNIVCTLPIHFAIDSFIFVKIAINSGDIAYMHCTPLGVNFKFFLKNNGKNFIVMPDPNAVNNEDANNMYGTCCF